MNALLKLAPLALLAFSSLFAGGCASSADDADVGEDEVDTQAAELSQTGGYKGKFNNANQGHGDFCVKLATGSAPLRYIDGSVTGFTLTAATLTAAPGTNAIVCPEPGMARLDAREVVKTSNGRLMYFHRGGWGFAVSPGATSTVHYGHILASDLAARGVRYNASTKSWHAESLVPEAGRGQVAGNGGKCTSLGTSYKVKVESIPAEMRYLGTDLEHSDSYITYGDPGNDQGGSADIAKGVHYTLLSWSWVNVQGGGVARGLIEDGATFRRCSDVPSIKLQTVVDSDGRKTNGWVQAIYGATKSGNGVVYGWTVYAHQYGTEPVVQHLVR